ncbi:Hypothetical protein POVN_LOCUS509 [uncultured virus]|nr:Hypothetical protein POVN_LOCUS509 [uncultured virus]
MSNGSGLCTYADSIVQSGLCRGPVGVPYVGDTKIFDLGWTGLEMKCVRVDDASQEAKYCAPYAGCVSPGDAYTRLFEGNGDPVVVCAERPSCARFCAFAPGEVQGAWVPGIKQLIGNFQLMVSPVGDHNFAFGLNNVPCPQPPSGRYIVPDFPRSTAPLSDCLGDPLYPLSDTPALWFDATDIATRPQRYGLPSLGCSEGAVVQMTGLYMTFKPTRPMQTPNVLWCNILVVLGKNYIGWLTRVGGTVTWVQSDLSGTYNKVGDVEPTSEFRVELKADNSYNIQFDTGTEIVVPTTESTSTGDIRSLNLSKVYFTQRVDNFNELHIILNRRQTRWNPQSCNAMYLYPPPTGYPFPDASADPLGTGQ